MKYTPRRHRATLTAAVFLLGSVVWGPALAGAQSARQPSQEPTAGEQQAEVRDDKAAVDAEIDVLQASKDEITRRLDQIDAALADADAAVAESDAAVRAAQAEIRTAQVELRRAEADVETLRVAIREMAIASYIHPPAVDTVQLLNAESLADAIIQRAFLDARAKRDVNLLDVFEAAETVAARRSVAVEVAAAQAETAARAATERRASLQSEEAQQAAFASDLRGRIDASLAESAALAEFDAELAEEIAAEQAALIARIPPEPEPAPEPVQARSDGGGQVADVPDTPTTGGSAPTTTTTTPAANGGGGTTTTRPPSTTTTTTPPPPPVSTDAPPLRTVQGITVNAQIADQVDALLTAARADGVPLSGWGYRSTERQIELRRAHCGPTYYDIWEKPASRCSPPTAIPGRSLHEKGLAIDLTHGGRTITSRSSVAFQWMRDNAARYGLKNLPSEPWHWSTTGG